MSLELSGTTPAIKGVAGSVSAPAITGDDVDTGISFPSADTIKFSAGGVEKFAISASGLSGDGSGLSGISAGITMADQWRRTAGVATNGGENFLTTDWERVDGTGQGTLTSSGGMTESGGIFTFPSTGIYKVEWQAYAEDSGASGTNAINIYVTTDNSSYSNVCSSVFSVPNTVSGYTYSYNSGHVQTFIDVTDTSQVKVKFRVYSAGTVVWDASSTENRNCATFIRLGDT